PLPPEAVPSASRSGCRPPLGPDAAPAGAVPGGRFLPVHANNRAIRGTLVSPEFRLCGAAFYWVVFGDFTELPSVRSISAAKRSQTAAPAWSPARRRFWAVLRALFFAPRPYRARPTRAWMRM